MREMPMVPGCGDGARTGDAATCSELPIIAAVLCVAAIGYVAVALVRPERF